jgi:hypothetical protein
MKGRQIRGFWHGNGGGGDRDGREVGSSRGGSDVPQPNSDNSGSFYILILVEMLVAGHPRLHYDVEREKKLFF